MNNLTTYKWSITEWHKLVDTGILAGKSVELLEGEIIQMSPEGIEHFYTNDSVADYLRELLRGRAKIFEAHPITLDRSEPEPDVAIVRLPKTIYRNHLPYPEDIYWLIEVSNKTLNIDLEQKAFSYARNAIREYWVIDLVNKQLVVHTQPEGDRYLQVVSSSVRVVSPQAFPDIEIPLDKLLLF